MAPKKSGKNGSSKKNGKNAKVEPKATGLWGAMGPMGLVGALLILISLFCVQWRYSPPQPALYYNMPRYYGLSQIRGNSLQTWSILTDSVCKQSNIYKSVAAVGFVGVIDTFFVANISARCSAYTQIASTSTVTFYCMCGCAVLGLVAGIFVYLGGMSLKPALIGMHGATALSILGGFYFWASFTDSQFMAIRNTGFYPYPSLSIMSYLCIAGAVLFTLSTLVGVISLLLEANAAAEQQFLKDKEDAAAAIEANELYAADM